MDLKEFIEKERSKNDTSIPWYKKKLNKNDFSTIKGKNGKLYLRHKDWEPWLYVGGYDDEKICDEIICSYVTNSAMNNSIAKPLTKSTNITAKIHTVIIYDKDFFVKKQ